MKRVLVLGAGLVAKPLVHYLLNQPDFEVTVASRTVSKADALVEGFSNGISLALNVKDDDALEKLVSEHDLSISLLPYAFHLKVANFCLKYGKHLVTTSYVKQDMLDLDSAAKEKGLLFLNEIGLDPGIDHMSAMKIFDQVWDNGGEITGFRSYCGGLPALDANNNPFGYKFSWSPKGVLMAAKNTGKYMVDNKVVDVPGDVLFDDYHFLDVLDFGTFEAYPNRDSMPYVDTYGFKGIKTMYRGTLRNIGHCETWRKMVELGMFEDETTMNFNGRTLADVFKKEILKTDSDDLEKVVTDKLNLTPSSVFIRKLRWLGFFSDTPIQTAEGTLLDVLTEVMLDRLAYAEGEQDLIVLHHEIEAEYPDRREHITSTLIDQGIPNGDSAMSRTVGLPAAIATALILTGKINLTGVKIPVDKEIYIPVLEELVNLGCDFQEYFNPVD